MTDDADPEIVHELNQYLYLGTYDENGLNKKTVNVERGRRERRCSQMDILSLRLKRENCSVTLRCTSQHQHPDPEESYNEQIP